MKNTMERNTDRIDKTEQKLQEATKKQGDPTMTRKEALVKAGKYAAFTAAGMLLVLSPKQSQASSALPPSPGFESPW